MNIEPIWYNPFKKCSIISFIYTDHNKDINYTLSQILQMDIKFISYYFRKNILTIIGIIFTIIGIILTCI